MAGVEEKARQGIWKTHHQLIRAENISATWAPEVPESVMREAVQCLADVRDPGYAEAVPGKEKAVVDTDAADVAPVEGAGEQSCNGVVSFGQRT